MKYTLSVTQDCNLACDYCYVGKKKARMRLSTADKIIDFAFRTTPLDEDINFGFFGGEPLLELESIKAITEHIENHASYDAKRVGLNLITNGTIISDEIIEFLVDHRITLGISCDGPPEVQDVFRKYAGGRTTSKVVESTIRKAVESHPYVVVNAVYHPRTFRKLPQVVEYFASLGVTQIYLNPDFSANWTREDIELFPEVFNEVAELYSKYYLEGNPRFVSLIDFKISVILRGGYHAHERCRMGRGEFAFTPEGNIYPCERLIGNGNGGEHCIGDVSTGLKLERLFCHSVPNQEVNSECRSCSLKEYCMNWCGCSNFMSTGFYNRVSPFTCASEKAVIKAALTAFETLENKLGPTFYGHLGGHEYF